MEEDDPMGLFSSNRRQTTRAAENAIKDWKKGRPKDAVPPRRLQQNLNAAKAADIEDKDNGKNKLKNLQSTKKTRDKLNDPKKRR